VLHATCYIICYTLCYKTQGEALVFKHISFLHFHSLWSGRAREAGARTNQLPTTSCSSTTSHGTTARQQLEVHTYCILYAYPRQTRTRESHSHTTLPTTLPKLSRPRAGLCRLWPLRDDSYSYSCCFRAKVAVYIYKNVGGCAK